MPRRPRLAWPSVLPVVLDFSDRLTPYWEDWHALARHLARRWPKAVRLYRLKGAPPGSLRHWTSSGLSADSQPWPQPPAKGILLVVGDLGMVDGGHAWPRNCWEAILRDYRRHGVRVVVLAPISRYHLYAPLVNAARVVRLSPDSDLRPLSRRASPVAPKPDSPHPSLATLLAMLSVATRAEPALLRAFRARLPEAAGDAGIEGELWCHPELDTSAMACALAPWAIDDWRQEFRKLPDALQRDTLECLRDWHAGLPQAIHHEETLLWRYLARRGADERRGADAARRFFCKLSNSLVGGGASLPEGGMRGLLVQLADRHVGWMAPTLGRQEEYLSELASAVAQAEPGRAGAALPAGINPVVWLRNRPFRDPRRVYLRQGPGPRLSFHEGSPSAGALPAGATPLGAVPVSRDAVLWGFGYGQEPVTYRPWILDDGVDPAAAPALPRLLRVEGTEPPLVDFFIHTGPWILRFKAAVLPPWAGALGQDRHGLYAGSGAGQGLMARYYWHPPIVDAADEISPGCWYPSAALIDLPFWATGGGRDAFGVYADLDVEDAVQRFRWMPPGRFLMGSPEDEPERSGDETQHPVVLTQGFWLADTACTQALWQRVMGDNPSRFQDSPDHPVENISWEDVQGFLAQLNGRASGLVARLPTEAEWEYACRAGTETPFSFGQNITPELVNYNGNFPYAGGQKGIYREKTVPVKSLPPNPWGLYEMHGNVWEWCADWYGDYPSGEAVDPMGPPEGAGRVLRGGSWLSLGGFVRSAYRYGFDPGLRDDRHGFRLALGRGGIGQASGRAAAVPAAAAERGGQDGRGTSARGSGEVPR